MTLTYAIPDLHGRLDLLESAIDGIVKHAGGRVSTIVTLGDYVDRGPNSRGVIEKLLKWKSATFRLVALKGNHESMMSDVCNNFAELSWWFENGGDRTLASYGSDLDCRAVPPAHLDWIANLPLMFVDQHRVFVHAAVDPRVSLDQQNEQTLLWKKYSESDKLGHGHRHVVHGHHANPKAPILTKGRTNLDALAWKTGRLVCAVFEDDRPGGAVEFLEISGPPGLSE